MFGSTILDIAAGIIFGFLAISLFTSAAVEAINSLFNVRAKNLKTGIMALVNDPGFSGLAKQLYEHALVSPLGPGAADPLKNAPAYIDKMQFAEALLDVTGLSAADPAAAAQAPGPQAVAALKGQIAGISDPQLRQLIQGIVNRSDGNIQKVKQDLANWFDNGMDSLSGRFKRQTQAMTFFIALVMAFLVNVDTIRIGTLLSGQPALIEKLKLTSIPSAPAASVEDAVRNGEQVMAAIDKLAQEGFPVGWAPGHFLDIQDDKGNWTSLRSAPFSIWYR